MAELRSAEKRLYSVIPTGGIGSRLWPLSRAEAPEFHSAVLDALRQPLESGIISIHRANAVAHFPGRFQLVMAANSVPVTSSAAARRTRVAAI